MTTDRALDPFWDQVRELFLLCADVTPDERRLLLARSDDAAVRKEVESLLAEHDQAAGFLDQSIWQLAEPAPAQQTGTMIGPYLVLQPIGHGGMGSVFLAERNDEQFVQRVALKLVRVEASGAEMLRRFRQERQILAALQHPNIARLLDVGSTSGGLPYLVMEYVEGIPIDVYCREHALSVEARLRLFVQLCDAVQYAHRNLVIHRDIKPSNVLVSAEGTPKLLDFGIAKLTSQEILPDATITRLMTPDYASPEQLEGRPVSTASDVYSLGVLLFELLTGEKPFAGRARTAATEAPRPSSSGPAASRRTLRGDLDRIVLMALDPDSDHRYGSAEKLAEDIERHLGGHPVRARRATLGYRTMKFVRRNRVGVAAAAIILVLTVVAFQAILRQKRLAERRFDQVRALAHSVVFELHDAIAPLPGSTAARELLVRRALVYLDALASDAGTNTALQMEVAGAYERVGDVQGLPYRPNLGDTAQALRSYLKGIAIAEQIRTREPENRTALSMLAELHDRAGTVEQRSLHFDDALHHHQIARDIQERMPDRDVAGTIALSRSWLSVGDCLFLSQALKPVHDESNTAGQSYEHALKILGDIPPSNLHRIDFLQALASAHQRLGGYYTHDSPRNPPLALIHHQAALHALEERASLEPHNTVARRNVADGLLMLATLQNSLGDGAGALDGSTRAMEVLGKVAGDDPQNIEAQHDLAFVYEQQGTARIHLHRWDESRRDFEQALTIRQRLVAADANNQEDRRGIAGIYALLATLYEAQGNPTLAAEFQQRSQTVFNELKR